MPAGMMWMVCGIAAAAWLRQLPSAAVLAGVALTSAALAVCLWRHAQRATERRAARHAAIALAAVTLGFLWGCGYGYYIRAGLLPTALEQQPLLLRGRIEGLVEQRPGFAHGAAARPVLRFRFAVDGSAASLPRSAHLPRLIRLNWYDADRVPRSGERWQLRVKLKRPRGFADPGGFDYEAWLVANRIGATGYVRRSDDNRRLAPAPRWSVNALRGRAQRYLQRRLHGLAHRDLLLGLLLGDGGAIAAAEWDTFRATGTVHLFVVSGLQVALTGGLALGCARLWWRSAWCASRRRNYLLGAVPAFVAALIYALLAGWGLPIQRALIMFAVLLWALAAQRRMRASTAWIAALWLVLLCDPLAVRAVGFWFSFVAVAAILLIVGGRRTAPLPRPMAGAVRWWRVQWGLFATSVPILLLLSGQLTLLALPANIIAIPLSTLLALPLAFLALLGDCFAPQLGELFWRGADCALDWLWRYLQWLQGLGVSVDGRHNWTIWHPPGIDAWLCAFAALAAALLLLPRGAPGRAFAGLLLVPLLAPRLPHVAPGDCTVTVIDVGQGLSVLVETAHHRLLYDTGPRFGSGRTAADLAVVPLLRRHGIGALDTVVLSHNDSDHAGGWPTVVHDFGVRRLLVGQNISEVGADGPRPQYCRAGMHWRWDGVRFDILYPTAAALRRFAGSDNDHSCVLQISADGARVLLTGDIERNAERVLLGNPALRPATLLLAPHHGSRSSSSAALVARVQPAYVVFSTGYRNRFHHPSASVVQRYRHSGAALFNTAFAGAVIFRFEHGHVARITRWRSHLHHYWD